MGFFDSFKKGFDEKTKQIEDLKCYNSGYQTVQERDKAQYDRFNRQSDDVLIKKYKDPSTSKNDTEILALILTERGYSKNNKCNPGDY